MPGQLRVVKRAASVGSSAGWRLSLLLCAVLWGAACKPSRPVAARDAGQADQGLDLRVPAPQDSVSGAAPELLLYAASRALSENDRQTARRLFDAAVERVSQAPRLVPVAGFRLVEDPDSGAASPPVLADVSASGTMLAIADRGLLSFVDLRVAFRIQRLPLLPSPVQKLSLSPDGRLVALLLANGTLRLYALSTGVLLHDEVVALSAPDKRQLYFDPSSRFLVVHAAQAMVGSPQATVFVIDAATGQRILLHAVPALVPPDDVTTRRDGTLTLIWGDRAPRFFDLRSGAEWLQPPSNPRSAAVSRCLSPSGNRAVSHWHVAPDRSALLLQADASLLCRWNLATHALQDVLDLHALGLSQASERPQLLSSQHVLLRGPRGQRARQAVVLEVSPSASEKRARPIQWTVPIRATATPLPLDDGGVLFVDRQAPYSICRLSSTFRAPFACQDMAGLPGARRPSLLAAAGSGHLLVLAERPAPSGASPTTLSFLRWPSARPPEPLALSVASPLLLSELVLEDQLLLVLDGQARLSIIETDRGTLRDQSSAPPLSIHRRVQPRPHVEVELAGGGHLLFAADGRFAQRGLGAQPPDLSEAALCLLGPHVAPVSLCAERLQDPTLLGAGTP